MPLQKNQILTLRIERLSSDGSGVAHSADGEAVFVPGTAPGDEARVRIVKDCGRYAFGILDELLTPSPDRIPVDCPVAGPCGGCSLRHLDYAAELRAKQESVLDAFRRIGGLEVPVLDILPSPDVDRYRNKVQFPVAPGRRGPAVGYYRPRSHDVLDVADCLLQPETVTALRLAFLGWMEDFHVPPYEETSRSGLIRHLYVRTNRAGEALCCVVANGSSLPHTQELVRRLRQAVPALAGVVLNQNTRDTNVILGPDYHTLWGRDFLEETLCGMTFRLSVPSFFQINRAQTERLYAQALDFAGLTGTETVLDLYCGIGTISLALAQRAAQVIGAEIVPQAIEDARANAARNGVDNVRFLCGDAGQTAAQLAREGIRPQVICVDPPRKGLAPEAVSYTHLLPW